MIQINRISGNDKNFVLREINQQGEGVERMLAATCKASAVGNTVFVRDIYVTGGTITNVPYAEIKINGTTPASAQEAVSLLNAFIGSFKRGGSGGGVSPEDIASAVRAERERAEKEESDLSDAIQYESEQRVIADQANETMIANSAGFLKNYLIHRDTSSGSAVYSLIRDTATGDDKHVDYHPVFVFGNGATNIGYYIGSDLWGKIDTIQQDSFNWDIYATAVLLDNHNSNKNGYFLMLNANRDGWKFLNGIDYVSDGDRPAQPDFIWESGNLMIQMNDKKAYYYMADNLHLSNFDVDMGRYRTAADEDLINESKLPKAWSPLYSTGVSAISAISELKTVETVDTDSSTFGNEIDVLVQRRSRATNAVETKAASLYFGTVPSIYNYYRIMPIAPNFQQYGLTLYGGETYGVGSNTIHTDYDPGANPNEHNCLVNSWCLEKQINEVYNYIWNKIYPIWMQGNRQLSQGWVEVFTFKRGTIASNYEEVIEFEYFTGCGGDGADAWCHNRAELRNCGTGRTNAEMLSTFKVSNISGGGVHQPDTMAAYIDTSGIVHIALFNGYQNRILEISEPIAYGIDPTVSGTTVAKRGQKSGLTWRWQPLGTTLPTNYTNSYRCAEIQNLAHIANDKIAVINKYDSIEGYKFIYPELIRIMNNIYDDFGDYEHRIVFNDPDNPNTQNRYLLMKCDSTGVKVINYTDASNGDYDVLVENNNVMQPDYIFPFAIVADKVDMSGNWDAFEALQIANEEGIYHIDVDIDEVLSLFIGNDDWETIPEDLLKFCLANHRRPHLIGFIEALYTMIAGSEEQYYIVHSQDDIDVIPRNMKHSLNITCQLPPNTPINISGFVAENRDTKMTVDFSSTVNPTATFEDNKVQIDVSRLIATTVTTNRNTLIVFNNLCNIQNLTSRINDHIVKDCPVANVRCEVGSYFNAHSGTVGNITANRGGQVVIDAGVTVTGTITNDGSGFVIDNRTGNPQDTFARKQNGYMAPNYSAMETTNRITAFGGSWTVDRNGYVMCSTVVNNGSGYIYINDKIVGPLYSGTQTTVGGIFQVSIGDVVRIAGSSYSPQCYFIPPSYVGSVQNTDITRPDLWAENTEISFGNNLYGKRVTGTITVGASTPNEVTLATGATNLVQSSGNWSLTNATGNTYNVNCSDKSSNNSYIYNNKSNGNIMFNSFSSTARTNAPYDVWVLYKK